MVQKLVEKAGFEQDRSSGILNTDTVARPGGVNTYNLPWRQPRHAGAKFSPNHFPSSTPLSPASSPSSRLIIIADTTLRHGPNHVDFGR